MQRFRAYITLCKPGIVIGNDMAAVAGYMLASTTNFSFVTFGSMLAGISFIMAASCVINNYFDRGIDAHMRRTARRGLVTHEIAPSHAWGFALLLLTIGSWLLYAVSAVVMLLGLLGVVSYAFVYTYAKKRTYHATLIGTLPGALPPVIGAVAAGGTDLRLLLALTCLLVSWQMVHFYAIALFRRKDYAAAQVPVISVVKSFAAVRQHMMVWMSLIVVSVLLFLPLAPITGVVLIGLTVLGALRLRPHPNTTQWARRIFLWSLLVLPLLLISSIIEFGWRTLTAG